MTKSRLHDGKVALVTGGGKGIGRAIALSLAAEGARVLLTGRDERALGEAVGEIASSGGQARHLVGDVRDEAHASDAVARAFEIWARLDIVIANAGVAGPTPMGAPPATAGHREDRTPEVGESASRRSRARAIVETNLLGTYFVFDAALERMNGPGRLIAISSVLGKFGVAGQAAYCASKAGIDGLVRAVAAEVGARRMTCNAICPGWVDTEMARSRIRDIAAEEGRDASVTRREAEREVPLGRFVEPEEVAGLVSFLCSPAADAISGQSLSICGGATLFAG